MKAVTYTLSSRTTTCNCGKSRGGGPCSTSPVSALNQPLWQGHSIFFTSSRFPIIVILDIWQHIYHKIPLFYHPQYWGMVFPLGMYTVCIWRLGQALELPYLQLIPSGFIYIALIAWSVTFFGLCVELIKGLGRLKTQQNNS